MNPQRRFVDQTVTVATAFVALLALQPRAATAQQAAGSEFSFAVYGDSRPMLYLPMNAGKPDLVKLFTEMFGLVMPEKMAADVVQKNVKMVFDSTTKELTTVIMPFMSKTEVMTLKVKKGWV